MLYSSPKTHTCGNKLRMQQVMTSKRSTTATIDYLVVAAAVIRILQTVSITPLETFMS